MSDIRATKTEQGDWVVADGGGWLPGVYDREETARYAAQTCGREWLEESQYLRLIYTVDGENRPVTMNDLPIAYGQVT